MRLFLHRARGAALGSLALEREACARGAREPSLISSAMNALEAV